MTSAIPSQGDILEGRIVRIESYGAFCRLESLGGRSPLQGLIHISQLVPDQRVERVDDVLSFDDRVWVKVLKVEMDPVSQRWKIQLSRKDVSQDGVATDLGKEREVQERKHKELESSLTSMIGMGVALDPMADRLVVKSRMNTFRGGYSLVGDDEGEPEPAVEVEAPRLQPLGRGRGTTLPAWMTQKSEGPTKSGDEADSDNDSLKKKKKKKSHHKSKKKSHHDKHRKNDYLKSERKRSHRDYGKSGISRSFDEGSQSSRSTRDRKRPKGEQSRSSSDRRPRENDKRNRSQRRSQDSSESR